MAIETADHLRDANPWQAEPDPVVLAVLGKLVEELGELQAAAARCIIQGMAGFHPVTGKPNVEWLMEEHADVRNMMNHLLLRMPLDADDLNAYRQRVKRKDQHIKQWLKQLTPSTT